MDNKGDVVDQGNEAAEMFRLSALSLRKPAGPAANGACHNCEVPLPPGRRFCSPECRDDWEKQQRAAFMAPREPDPEPE